MLKRSTRIDPLPRWKRAFDLAGASIGLLLLAPLMILIALYIKCVSRGPVLFKHKRYGYLGEPLYVWKFRSMHVHADPVQHQKHVMSRVQGDAAMTKMNTDAHLIPMGKWLRSTAIDEFPQLFNVFKSEMSLVGPRPDVVPIDEYEDWHQTRFDVLPGLTGLWQVSGKNQTTFREMNELDSFYVEQRSFRLDLKILILTLPAIIKQVAEEFISKRYPTKTHTT